MIVRYCSCFFVPFYTPFPPLGTTWVEAAEGGNRYNDCHYLTDSY